MVVHVFEPNGTFGERGETFCGFIERHYKIPVEVHEYGDSIVEFLKKEHRRCLTASVLLSSFNDCPILSLEDSISCDVNKIITKNKNFHLGGIVIADSDSDSSRIGHGSILKIFEGMFDVPIITI